MMRVLLLLTRVCPAQKLNEQTDTEIAAMKTDSKKSLDEISHLLLRYVADVNTDVHVNNQKVEAK